MGEVNFQQGDFLKNWYSTKTTSNNTINSILRNQFNSWKTDGLPENIRAICTSIVIVRVEGHWKKELIWTVEIYYTTTVQMLLQYAKDGEGRIKVLSASISLAKREIKFAKLIQLEGIFNKHIKN